MSVLATLGAVGPEAWTALKWTLEKVYPWMRIATERAFFDFVQRRRLRDAEAEILRHADAVRAKDAVVVEAISNNLHRGLRLKPDGTGLLRFDVRSVMTQAYAVRPNRLNASAHVYFSGDHIGSAEVKDRPIVSAFIGPGNQHAERVDLEVPLRVSLRPDVAIRIEDGIIHATVLVGRLLSYFRREVGDDGGQDQKLIQNLRAQIESLGGRDPEQVSRRADELLEQAGFNAYPGWEGRDPVLAKKQFENRYLLSKDSAVLVEVTGEVTFLGPWHTEYERVTFTSFFYTIVSHG